MDRDDKIIYSNTFLNVVHHRDSENLKKCLQEGANPNERFPNGDSALHHILSHVCSSEECSQEDENCTKLLLDFGANPYMSNTEGQTPLELAFKNRVPLPLGQLLVSRSGPHADNSADRINIAGYSHDLANLRPEIVHSFLDQGIKFTAETPSKLRTDEDREKVEIELDWRYIVYDYYNDNPKKIGRWHETKFLHMVLDATSVAQDAVYKHPLTTAFRHLKEKKYWKYFGRYYFASVVGTFILYLAFIWNLYNDACRYDKRNGPFPVTTTSPIAKEEDKAGFRCYFSKNMSILAYAVLISYAVGPLWVEVREISAVRPKQYFRDWQNYVIIIATFIAIVTLWPALLIRESYYFNFEYAAAAGGMLIGSIVILIQFSSITFIAVYVEMVFKTFKRIVMTTIILCPLLIGFYFAFRILITDQEIGVFKLLTMIVSPDGYEELIDHTRGEYYTYVAYIFFSFFILVVILVVMNFLIGLAVGDTQKLKEKAESANAVTNVRTFYLMDTFLGKQPLRCCVTRNKRDNKFDLKNFKFRPFAPKNNSRKFGLFGKSDKNHKLPEELELELFDIARQNRARNASVEAKLRGRFPVAAYNPNIQFYPSDEWKAFNNNHNNNNMHLPPSVNSHSMKGGSKWYDLF